MCLTDNICTAYPTVCALFRTIDINVGVLPEGECHQQEQISCGHKVQFTHIKKNTCGRFVIVEITLETVENVWNRRENSHGIDNRVPRISHVRVDLFGRFITVEKNRVRGMSSEPCMGDVIGFRDNE